MSSPGIVGIPSFPPLIIASREHGCLLSPARLRGRRMSPFSDEGGGAGAPPRVEDVGSPTPTPSSAGTGRGRSAPGKYPPTSLDLGGKNTKELFFLVPSPSHHGKLHARGAQPPTILTVVYIDRGSQNRGRGRHSQGSLHGARDHPIYRLKIIVVTLSLPLPRWCFSLVKTSFISSVSDHDRS